MSDEDNEILETVVIDNGSGTFLAGLSDQVSPRCIIKPNAVGRPKHKTGIIKDDNIIGDRLYPMRNTLSLSYPIERGVVTNWDDMERIWRYMYDQELRIKSEDRPVLIADATLNPAGNREKMLQVMMETFHVPGFLAMNQGLLSLYASGRTTGTVLNVGDGVCHVDTAYEGESELSSRRRIEVAGRDLTLYLQKLLYARGYSFTTAAEIEMVREIKENLCCVRLHKETDNSKSSTDSPEKSYSLPDGSKLTLNNERFLCPEALLKPSLLGFDFPGIHELVKESIDSCDISSRRSLYNNIILSGASTMFPQLHSRLDIEIRALVSDHLPLRVIAPPERRSSAWIGGAVVSSLSSFDDILISRQEYEEFGPGIVHRKCRYL